MAIKLVRLSLFNGMQKPWNDVIRNKLVSLCLPQFVFFFRLSVVFYFILFFVFEYVLL